MERKTRWRPWQDFCTREGVDVVVIDLPPPHRALLAQRGDRAVIFVARSLPKCEQLAALAHELVHLERGHSGWIPECPEVADLVAREEATVEEIVVERLIPPGELAALAERRRRFEPRPSVDMVAKVFQVPEWVASLALSRLQVA